MELGKKEKEINNKRIHQIANIMNKKKKYNDGDIELKPAYKQSKKEKNLMRLKKTIKKKPKKKRKKKLLLKLLGLKV